MTIDDSPHLYLTAVIDSAQRAHRLTKDGHTAEALEHVDAIDRLLAAYRNAVGAASAAVLAECDAIEADYREQNDGIAVGARAAVMRIRARATVPSAGGDLRDRIAEALYAHIGFAARYRDLDQDQRDAYLARADAVLAVLPAPVDRAAALREAIAALDDLMADGEHDPSVYVERLRRMADETQQSKPQSRCTCADAGACFAPAGHYADCPAA